jgi:NAD(P)-dependent dehydrogenase (short-subunit alcohol dehydrogenase family)
VNLKGVSALVAGGAGGLGEASVRCLVGAGVHVAIADVDTKRGQRLEAELDGMATYVAMDVLDEASVDAAVVLAESMGNFSISVDTHGGFAASGRLVDRELKPLEIEDFRRAIEIYLTGTFNVMRLAAASMARREPDADGNRGVIINTASIAAFEGQVGQLAYAGAKAGVAGMTLVAARDLAPAGIRVMSVAPGTFLTPAFKAYPDDVVHERWGSKVPFPNRMGRPEEYGALALHICENDYLNGEVLRLCGALRLAPK